jgi:hypothetical protein
MSDAQRKANEQGKEVDRHWFLMNPGRNYCVRPALPDEAPACRGLVPCLVINQVRPGARLRVCIYADRPPPRDFPELAAEREWERAMERDPETARRFAQAEAEILEGPDHG